MKNEKWKLIFGAISIFLSLLLIVSFISFSSSFARASTGEPFTTCDPRLTHIAEDVYEEVAAGNFQSLNLIKDLIERGEIDLSDYISSENLERYIPDGSEQEAFWPIIIIPILIGVLIAGGCKADPNKTWCSNPPGGECQIGQVVYTQVGGGCCAFSCNPITNEWINPGTFSSGMCPD